MVFYHLRHTALSNLQLIAERQWDLAELATGYTEPQMKTIHNVMFGKNETLRIYWGLACFAGHNSPATTLHHYLHFSDVITYRKLIQNQITLNYAAIKALTYLSGKQIIKTFGREQLNCIPLVKCRVLLIDELKKQTQTQKEVKTKAEKLDKTKDQRSEQQSKSKITHALAYKILSEVQQGYDIALLSNENAIDEALIERCVNKAKNLQQLTTREGHSRLIAAER